MSTTHRFAKTLLIAAACLLAAACAGDEPSSAAADAVAAASDTAGASTPDAGADQASASGAKYLFDINGIRWGNVPGGAAVPPAELFAGKVVLVTCFQAWCPGCRSHGLPLMKDIVTLYGDNHAFVGVFMQTVFEGSAVNTYANGLSELTDYHKIRAPFYAHNPGQGGAPPFMRTYKVGATPWFVLFGKDGKVISSSLGVGADEPPKIWLKRLDDALAAPAPAAP